MLLLCHHSHYILSLILNSIELNFSTKREKKTFTVFLYISSPGTNVHDLRTAPIFIRLSVCECVCLYFQKYKQKNLRKKKLFQNWSEKNVWRQRQVISNLKIKLNLTKSQKHKHNSNGWMDSMLSSSIVPVLFSVSSCQVYTCWFAKRWE